MNGQKIKVGISANTRSDEVVAVISKELKLKHYNDFRFQNIIYDNNIYIIMNDKKNIPS
jgi:hypothetical protein